MKTAVIVARFQTPYLHEGHKNLLDTIFGVHKKIVIVLGVSPLKGGKRNPFDYHVRERMIKSMYPNAIVLPLRDHPVDAVWSENLDKLLNETFHGERMVLYGSRDSFIPYYSGTNEVVELAESSNHNATQIREELSEQVLDSVDFRTGILYAFNAQYPKIYATVDVAVLRNEKKEVLLGKKSTNNKWRMIGGFVDPEDDSYDMAARRELTEECGPIEVGAMQYELSAKIDDWRYRNETDKIISTLFTCEYVYGEPKAQDDIADVAWFTWEEVQKLINEKATTEEHHLLFAHLVQKYSNER